MSQLTTTPPIEPTSAALAEHDRGRERSSGVGVASARTAWPISRRSFLSWLGAFVAMTALWTAAGFAVTRWFEGTALHEAESDLARWFEAQRTPTLNDVSHWISFSGDAVPKTIFIGLLAAVFIAVWGRLHEAVFLVATMGLEVAVFAATSTLVGRERPPVEQLDGSLPTSSFPSGHVAASVALYGALAVIVFWRTRRPAVRAAAVVFGVVWPAVMTIIRLYRGMHYLSDVVFGVVLGLAAIAVGLAVVRQGLDDLNRRRDLPEHARRLSCVHAAGGSVHAAAGSVDAARGQMSGRRTEEET